MRHILRVGQENLLRGRYHRPAGSVDSDRGEKRGDEALLHYTRLYDRISLSPKNLEVKGEEVREAHKKLPPALQGIQTGDFFYFVHSYYVVPEEKDSVATLTTYGAPFVSSIWKENIFAIQFHPEKSQEKGLRVLENFVKAI